MTVINDETATYTPPAVQVEEKIETLPQAEPLESEGKKNGEPCRSRTCDPLIKSCKSPNSDQKPIVLRPSNLLYFLTKRFEEVY